MSDAHTHLPPYPQTKESGVPWLGEIPAHWETRKLRHIMTSVTERNRPDFPLLSVVREKGVILRDVSSSDENHNYIPDDLSNYKVVRQGQFAMNKMKAWQGSFGVSSYDGIVSPAYYVFALTGVEGGFFHTALRSRAYIPFFTQASDGVRIGQWDLSKTRMREIPFFVPPLAEQTAIARYLDYVDRRVRRYIKAKRRLIEVLTEQKQAIIHQAVTRGLDPDVPMKESGIEWLGEVPAHWEVVLNQRIFKEQIRPHNGETETQLSLSQIDGLIPTSAMRERSLQTSTFDNWKVTIPGDLVLNRFKAHLGVFFASTLRGIVSFHYGVFSPRQPLVSKYFELLYHTNPYRTIYAGRSNGMTVGLQNLSNQNFYNVRSPFPPITEQREIVDYAEKATQKIDLAIDSTRHEIDLIREYRTRLIADVVTGKVDVRGAAASLGEEAGVDMGSADQDEAWGDEGLDEELAEEQLLDEVDE